MLRLRDQEIKQLLCRVKEMNPQIRKLEMVCGHAGERTDLSTQALAERCLRSMGQWRSEWECQANWLHRDAFGAPYLPAMERGWLTREDDLLTITSTESRGLRLCLATFHRDPVMGIGIDYVESQEFSQMFQGDTYCGGRMFTSMEQKGLEEIKSTDEKLLYLAQQFSAKEAALKCLSGLLRQRFRPEDTAQWSMKFLEFEIRQDSQGQYAIPFGKTAQTAEELKIQRIALYSVPYEAGVVSVAVCVGAR